VCAKPRARSQRRKKEREVSIYWEQAILDTGNPKTIEIRDPCPYTACFQVQEIDTEQENSTSII
jgi:hypothetical protein